MDASQGVEAQTLANAYLAVDNNLEIIPVINKIDLPSAQPEEARRQLEEIIGLDGSSAILASAKEGRGVKDILEAVVSRLPAPGRRPGRAAEGPDFRPGMTPTAPIVVRVLEGTIRERDEVVTLMNTRQDHEVESLGVFSPKAVPVDQLGPRSRLPGHCIKVVADAYWRYRHRDDLPDAGAVSGIQGAADGLCRLVSSREPSHAELRESLEKSRLNDASFFFEPETSVALGFGFRCGFLGLLHGDRAGAASSASSTWTR